MSDDTKSHAEQVWDWVEENMERYPHATRVTLHEFEIDWDKLRGAFNVLLDDQAFPHRLAFSLGECGRVSFSCRCLSRRSARRPVVVRSN